MDEYFPPGYGKFAMTWSCVDTDYDATCTFGFRNIPNLTAAEATAELQPIWYEAGRPSHIGGMADQWTNVRTYCLLQQVGYQTSWVDELGTTGTDTDPAPPAAMTLVVSKRTDRAGKRYRGRFAWPPFLNNETLVDAGGLIDSGVMAGLQGRFTDALDAMTTAALPMVLIHTRITLDDVPTPTIVQALDVQQRMGVQRKRMRR